MNNWNLEDAGVMSSHDLVVLGLGYVGLPLAQAASMAGLRVAGFDPDPRKIDLLNEGRSYVDDVTDEDVAEMRRVGFSATTDSVCLSVTETAVICVPTPLRVDGAPDLAAVESAVATVRDHLHPGMLVVLESTTYPGTTDEVVRPVLEATGMTAGVDFHLAFSPERIDPGNPVYGLRNTPKVVGGVTPACTDAATRFYGKFVDTVVPTRSSREAEMAKLLENTYRHVNIALVNEMAVFCDELGVDLWDAIAAASTKPFGFQAFYPGPGVGGHCIPIDPNYLSYRVKLLGYPFRFVELAQEINARMPAYVCTRVQRTLNDLGRPVQGSKVLLLGVTYKPDIADDRESPAQPLGKRLLELGAELAFHDPHVERWRVNEHELERADDVLAAVRDADIVILLQPHSSYDLDQITKEANVLFDTRGRLAGDNVVRL